MLCLSGQFKLYSRWVPLTLALNRSTLLGPLGCF